MVEACVHLGEAAAQLVEAVAKGVGVFPRLPRRIVKDVVAATPLAALSRRRHALHQRRDQLPGQGQLVASPLLTEGQQIAVEDVRRPADSILLTHTQPPIMTMASPIEVCPLSSAIETNASMAARGQRIKLASASQGQARPARSPSGGTKPG